MVLNVFFSHSRSPEDSWIADSVENYYRTNPQFGVDIYIAERYPEPGRQISEKIMERISEACKIKLEDVKLTEKPVRIIIKKESN